MKPNLYVPLLAETMMAQELEIERKAAEDGAARYEAMSEAAIQRGDGASLRPAERLCGAWFHDLHSEIRALRTSIAIGEAGTNRNLYGPILQASNLRALTAITLHETISHVMMSPKGCTLVKAAYAVGSSAVADIHARIGRERKADMTDLMNEIRRHAKRTPQLINRWAKNNLDDHVFNRKALGTLGLALVWKLVGVALIADDDGNPHAALAVNRHVFRNRPQNWISLRPAVQLMMSHAQIIRAGMRPRFGPMVVPPLPWSQSETGELIEGGHYRLRTPFVVKPTNALRSRLKTARMPEVFSAVNSLSATAWQVDPFIKNTVSDILAQGGGVAGIPTANPLMLPPKPTGLDELKLWRRSAAQIHESNAKAFSSRQDLLLALSTADSLEDARAIWFPHQLDFRSRTYPVPLHLNHTGEDPRRAMLRFAAAVPVTNTRWLKIHAANCWGNAIDKLPFDDRVAWVDKQARDIEQAQSDPLRHDGWMQAEAPFQFLAACRALCSEAAAARLPIHQDGSCNGLQQYAAMGRDHAGGRSVNLTPSERPQDVYASVAAVCAAAVQRLADQGVAQAKVVAPFIDRKMVKQPVMTSVYGVTRSGVRSQLEPRLLERGIDKREIGPLSHWLSKIVMESIGEALCGASGMMRWLRESCGAILKADRNRPIRWTSPLGFPVLQPYWNTRTYQVGVNSGFYEIALASPMEDSPQQLSWNTNGIAPNFVHSIDASHMLMTANAMARRGLDFAAVHDSFWSHVAHADDLAAVLRAEFIALHSVDLPARLKSQWESLYDIKLADLPEQGTLNIADVARSPYFFS